MRYKDPYYIFNPDTMAISLSCNKQKNSISACRIKNSALLMFAFLSISFIFPFSGKTQCTLIINTPPTTCEGLTVDLTLPAVTEGSSEGLTLTYWQDTLAKIALDAPQAVDTTGTYYIKAVGDDACVVVLPVDVTVTSKPNLVINDPDTVCIPAHVDITLPEITAGSDPGLTLSYWIDASGTRPFSLASSVPFSGTFYIKAEAIGGCMDFKPVNVTIVEVPILVINDPTPPCLGEPVDLTLPSITEGSSPDLTFTYWEDLLTTIVLNNPDSVHEPGTYYISGGIGHGCSVTSPVEVGFLIPYQDMEMAIISVDTMSGKNKIFWDPTVDMGIDFLNIYKLKSGSAEYELLEMIADISVGTYTDQLSEPETLNDSYKVSIVDTCGNESVLSPAHKSINLRGNTVENNWISLEWNSYEGRDIGFYIIYRKSQGGEYEIVGNVLSSILSYTDATPPELPLTYIVEAIPADQEVTLNMSSLSNDITIGSSSVDWKSVNQDIKVFPIPFDDHLNVVIPGDDGTNGIIELRNFLGQLIHQWEYKSTPQKIDTSAIPEGTYILMLKGTSDFRRLIVK